MPRKAVFFLQLFLFAVLLFNCGNPGYQSWYSKVKITTDDIIDTTQTILLYDTDHKITGQFKVGNYGDGLLVMIQRVDGKDITITENDISINKSDYSYEGFQSSHDTAVLRFNASHPRKHIKNYDKLRQMILHRELIITISDNTDNKSSMQFLIDEADLLDKFTLE